MTDEAERTAEPRPADSGQTKGSDGAAGNRRGRTLGRDLLAAGTLAVILTALGFPFAMVWQIITPRVEFVATEAAWVGVQTYPDGYVLADLYFAGMGLVLGVLAALVSWAAMRERRGPIALLGLVIGSVGCQVVAWRIGQAEWDAFWDAMRGATPGVHMWRPPSVLFVELDPGAAWEALKVGHFTEALSSLQLGALAVMALAAVFTYTVCAGWSRRPSLRSHVPE